MNKIREFFERILCKDYGDDLMLDDRIEFRLNHKEKILIKRYCELQHINRSEFFRNLAMKEIDQFINNAN